MLPQIKTSPRKAEGQTDSQIEDRHMNKQINTKRLMLVLCRVALIFRVRSAQKLTLSDGVLLRRLGLLVLLYSAYLTVWTAMAPPDIEEARTSDDLKFTRCVENWFDFTVIFGK